MVITGDNPQIIYDLQCYLGKHFEMKDLGTLNYFLGLEILFLSNDYYLSQARLITTTYLKQNMSLTSSVNLLLLIDFATSLIPMDPNVRFTPFDGVSTTCWQPNLLKCDPLYVIHIVGQFMTTSHTIHFTVVLCILCYIKDILGHDLQFSSVLSRLWIL